MEYNFKMFTFNSTGMGATSVDFVKVLLSFSAALLLVQETWHIDNHADHLLDIDKRYFCHPVSGMDENEELLKGRPYGGTAIYYSKQLAKYVVPIKTGSRRFSAIKLTLNNSENVLILNTYLPNDNYSLTKCSQEFMMVVDQLETFVLQKQSVCSHIVIAGDFNVDPDRVNAHFKYLSEMMDRIGLTSCWSHPQAVKDYTYISNDGRGMSCIDHVYTSKGFYDSLNSADVMLHALNPSNHRPVCCTFDLDLTSEAADAGIQYKPKVAWHKANEFDINNYCSSLDSALQSLPIPPQVLCRDPLCIQSHHKQCTDNYAESIIKCMLDASDCLPKTSQSKKLPGWKDKVKPLRDKAIFWHNLWKDNGKPVNGIIADIMRSTRKLYHKQVKHIQREKTLYRNEKMASAIASNTDRDLWEEIRKMNSGPPAVNVLDGKTDSIDIANGFAEKYDTLYNSVGYDGDELQNIMDQIDSAISLDSPNSTTHYVSITEIVEAIKMLNPKKCDGNHGLFTNHFKNAPHRLALHLSHLFSSMLTHGCTPSELRLSTLTSIPKDLKESLTTSDNYRGIALGSIMCKIYDIVMINRYSDILSSSSMQFAYKSQHSTALCTNLVRETAEHYISNDGCIYTCLLDASKAFDRVNFVQLFKILMNRGLPPIVIRSIINMYTSQEMRACWKGYMSNSFSVTNGTKQGAILSCSLFCLYLDQLLLDIESSGYGCYIGTAYMGALSYADDITLSSPSLTGLQKMVDICSNYAVEYHMQFNPKKTVCMRISRDGKQPSKTIVLNGKCLSWVSKAKHLGNWVTSTNDDCEDINIKSGHLIAATNKLIVKFPTVSFQVKKKLFQAYCTSYYGSQSWLLSNVNAFDKTWRKVVRWLFMLPWKTHCALLPAILKQDNAMVSIEKRVCRYLHNCLSSENELVSYVFKRAALDFKGLIGQNMKYLLHKYGIESRRVEFAVNAALDCIQEATRPSENEKLLASLINELRSCEISILSQQDQWEMLEMLCTQ